MKQILLCFFALAICQNSVAQQFTNAFHRNTLIIGVDNEIQIPLEHPKNCTVNVAGGEVFFEVRKCNEPGRFIIHPHLYVDLPDTTFQQWYALEQSGEDYQWEDGQKVWYINSYDDNPESENYGVLIGTKKVTKTSDDPILTISTKRTYISLQKDWNLYQLEVMDGPTKKNYPIEVVLPKFEVFPMVGYYGNGAKIPAEEFNVSHISTRVELSKEMHQQFNSEKLVTELMPQLKANVVSFECMIIPEDGPPLSIMQNGNHMSDNLLHRIRENSPCRVAFMEIRALCWDQTIRNLENVIFEIENRYLSTATSFINQAEQRQDVKGSADFFYNKFIYELGGNTVRIRFNEAECGRIDLSSNDAFIRSTDDPGVFDVIPRHIGPCQFFVKGESRLNQFMDTLQFDVQPLPTPLPRFGSITPMVSKATAGEFGAPALMAWFPEDLVLRGLKADITSYDVRIESGREILNFQGYGPALSSEIRNALMDRKKGDRVHFENIQCTLCEKRYVTLESIHVEVK